MRFSVSGLAAVVATLAAQGVSGHYIFQSLAAGSAKGTPYEYVRQNTNHNSPVTDLSSPDLRCNVGGATGGGTKTLTLNAGDAFTFTLDQAVYHQGPVSIYMSKAPGAAADYNGSGPWFKIKDWGPDFSRGQAVWTMAGKSVIEQSVPHPVCLRASRLADRRPVVEHTDEYTSNIPRCIPSGEYLLRIQSLAIHNPGATPQWYMSCGQVKVQGGGNTNPSPTASIPGAFKATDPGYTVNIYNPDFKSYTVPGPAVFSC
ncbi:hypothetical protein DL766_001884 [Monosporascus sp. MC13-8B]|uniref:lytic cellulose monooxygenase (C4-dehydrogenating) n=1 Tax=Monosporascus cannonballus TaxID=155416 RepID=A0ABY0H9J4_9PEZI|nr:hypothetical protein DL762_005287 [Monosporascus cannonballus]RYO85398.1 hypothetical protein DL763_007114 [Monosporascus cannonballus]RYP36644.1 hypothetical protein DL766_001884 [Monosporascus sp. MC13-8B]